MKSIYNAKVVKGTRVYSETFGGGTEFKTVFVFPSRAEAEAKAEKLNKEAMQGFEFYHVSEVAGGEKTVILDTEIPF